MSAAAILTALAEHGVTLAIEGERLTASPARSLTDAMRAEIRAHKPELIACLTQAANATEDATPHRLWLISPPDGKRYSASFTPPKTRAEVLERYPEAEVEIEVKP